MKNPPVAPRGSVAVEHHLEPVHHGFDLQLRARALDAMDQATALEVALLHVAALCREWGVNPQEALRGT